MVLLRLWLAMLLWAGLWISGLGHLEELHVRRIKMCELLVDQLSALAWREVAPKLRASKFLRHFNRQLEVRHRLASATKLLTISEHNENGRGIVEECSWLMGFDPKP
jgi:hypothetical protein